jgi:hypothetical protein
MNYSLLNFNNNISAKLINKHNLSSTYDGFNNNIYQQIYENISSNSNIIITINNCDVSYFSPDSIKPHDIFYIDDLLFVLEYVYEKYSNLKITIIFGTCFTQNQIKYINNQSKKISKFIKIIKLSNQE